MNASNILSFLHFLSIFWMLAGLAAVMMPIYQSWGSRNISAQVIAFDQAYLAHGSLLLPGTVFTGLTGVPLALERGYNLLTTGWLLTLELLYLFILMVSLPLVGFGLHRVRLLSLQAAKEGQTTSELQEMLADNVPVVFGTLTVFLIPVIVWLAVFKPF